ncbi:MAG: NAD(P)/FAD-dependent oxidoreductase [Chitinophagaceae bacterium]|nr:MAG: NAD(P)/FAD-dependent oxidoreductase [Chitinophagaceae bacterium]
MNKVQKYRYDCAVIGGGLAGLALSIQLAGKGFRVIVFEQKHYPFHKVCGEYVSLESVHFLEELGVPWKEWDLPLMKRLILTGLSGKEMVASLPAGGLGISRYRLDASLAEIAKQSGVEVCEQTKVTGVQYRSSSFYIESGKGILEATVCCGAFGKRSNLDVKWERKFVQPKGNKRPNFVGIKYHAMLDHPKDVIALHLFKNGYCGISAIEDHKYCICYITTAANLHKHQHDIPRMEQVLLSKNPYLSQIFSSAHFLYKEPLTISQIGFDKKEQVKDHILMVGDAAGMIAPLCGNGMSMALHGSKIAAGIIADFLYEKIDRSLMEYNYREEWKNTFNKRIYAGRIIQNLFGHPALSHLIIQALRPFPASVSWIIKQTHGGTF